MEERKRQEIEFHDRLRDGAPYQRWSQQAEALLKDDPLWANFKWYSIERKSVAYVHDCLRNRCPGKVVLDYGCGSGEDSLFAARHGAREVVGVDISPVAVENSINRIKAEGFDNSVRFLCIDGEAMPFPDSTFDFAIEYGVLHHVDLHAAMRELVRVLKPGGEMICTETLGHNPAIRLYRRMTPHLRTPWENEHVLRKEDFEIISRYFNKVEMKFFHLFTLCAVPFRNVPMFHAVLSVLEGIDDILFHLPVIKWQAWQTVFILSEPKKTTI